MTLSDFLPATQPRISNFENCEHWLAGTMWNASMCSSTPSRSMPAMLAYLSRKSWNAGCLWMKTPKGSNCSVASRGRA